MKTVPLYGPKARGRVALVDDEDYDLVMQYRWNVHEKSATATTRGAGPYAITNTGGKIAHRTIFMHCLIMGVKGIDHIDHDGLNNQRANLRPATVAQNQYNKRPRREALSLYKGVDWISRKRKWRAKIKTDGRSRHLGYFYSELEAACVYDAAAREAFGEFACTNFPEPPTQAMRDEWETARIAILAERVSGRNADHAEWWTQREAETRICTICGSGYQTRCSRPTLYCSDPCRSTAKHRRKKERELEGRLF